MKMFERNISQHFHGFKIPVRPDEETKTPVQRKPPESIIFSILGFDHHPKQQK